MMYAENIVNAYDSRKKSENWVEWVHQYPQAAKMLAEAEKLCH